MRPYIKKKEGKKKKKYAGALQAEGIRFSVNRAEVTKNYK